MLKNLTIAEFEAMITTRILTSGRMRDRHSGGFKTEYPYSEIITSATYTANDILKEIEINQDLWCMLRGRRAYIFHLPTKRIAGELGVVTDSGDNGSRKRARVVILGRNGFTKSPTVGDLAVAADRLGKRRPMKMHKTHLEMSSKKKGI